MRPLIRTIIAAMLTAPLLTACGGGGEKASNTVQMKDMEVVDGTATDAMTDLDGVQSEGTAVAETGGNATKPAAGAAQASNGSAAPSDAEVLADQ